MNEQRPIQRDSITDDTVETAFREWLNDLRGNEYEADLTLLLDSAFKSGATWGMEHALPTLARRLEVAEAPLHVYRAWLDHGISSVDDPKGAEHWAEGKFLHEEFERLIDEWDGGYSYDQCPDS